MALRSSALVQFGLPIELDVVAPGAVGADDADAVRQLTAVIDRGIRAVSPDFPDVETALALDQAAQVALSSRDDPDPSLEERADLARRLGRADARGAGRACAGTSAATSPLLSGLHLTDADVVAPDQPDAPAPLGLLASPCSSCSLGGLVAATALVNVWPAALVVAREPAREDAGVEGDRPRARGAGRVPHRVDHRRRCWPPTAFLQVTASSCSPRRVGALAAIWMVERAMALARMLLRWQAQRERIGTVGLADEVRAEVVDTVRAVAGRRDASDRTSP